MPITQPNLSSRFDIKRYRKAGRTYRAYYEFDIPDGATQHFSAEIPVKFLLIDRRITLSNGDLRYQVLSGSTLNANGPEITVYPLDLVDAKAAQGMVYRDSTFSAEGVELDLAVLKTPSQKVSTFSLASERDVNRFYPPSLFHIKLTNPSSSQGSQNAQGVLTLEWGETETV